MCAAAARSPGCNGHRDGPAPRCCAGGASRAPGRPCSTSRAASRSRSGGIRLRGATSAVRRHRRTRRTAPRLSRPRCRRWARSPRRRPPPHCARRHSWCRPTRAPRPRRGSGRRSPGTPASCGPPRRQARSPRSMPRRAGRCPDPRPRGRDARPDTSRRNPPPRAGCFSRSLSGGRGLATADRSGRTFPPRSPT